MGSGSPIRGDEFCAVQLHMAPFEATEDYLHSGTIAAVALLRDAQDPLTDQYCTGLAWMVAGNTNFHRFMLCLSVVYGKFSSLFV